MSAALALLGLTSTVHALGPHEVAVLVNKNSQRSLEVANTFIQLRHVPSANIVMLSLPDSVLASEAEISPDDFMTYIWEPAHKTLRDRHIEDHILAWIYSVDFPVRVMTTPPLSLQGMTFVRGKAPDASQITDGTFLSPLFRGPDKVDGPLGESITLERFTPMLRQAMPLPSMMLGFCGARGMPVDDVVRNLKYGAASDRSAPSEGVYFVTNSDIRSRCRDWQFPRVKAELAGLGVRAEITTNPPGKGHAIIGLQMGQSWVDTQGAGTFMPGAMAEHLTSFGAYFHNPEQTVLTEWLRAGATASAGTVVEPMSMWTKFPAARFFSHYAAGCTMLESFYESLRSPMQILLVGEPLAKPWAQPVELTLVNLGEEGEPARGDAEFMATVWAGMDQPAPELLFLVDGRAIEHAASDPRVKLDTRRLTDGYHDIRAIAYARQQVRHQSFSIVDFEVANRDRGCQLVGLASNAEIDIDHPLRLNVQAKGEPKEIAVISQERVLSRTPFKPDAVLFIDPRVVGEGPVALQAVALYPDNEAVRSRPVNIRVGHLDQAPTIAIEPAGADTNGAARLVVRVTDPENDNVIVDWLQRLQPRDVANGTLLQDQGVITVTATSDFAVAYQTWPGATNLVALTAELAVPQDSPPMKRQVAGLVFDYQDPENYSFFGLFCDASSWVFGRREKGTWKRAVTRGAFLETEKWYRIVLRRSAKGGVEAWVNDEFVCAWTDGRLAGAGLLAGVESGRFRNFRVSPPSIPEGAFAADHEVLTLRDAKAAEKQEIVARAWDGAKSAEATWTVGK